MKHLENSFLMIVPNADAVIFNPILRIPVRSNTCDTNHARTSWRNIFLCVVNQIEKQLIHQSGVTPTIGKILDLQGNPFFFQLIK